jgi:hypothetical protein
MDERASVCVCVCVCVCTYVAKDCHRFRLDMNEFC